MKNKPILLALIAVGLLGVAAGGFAVAVLGPTLSGGHVTEAEVRSILRNNPDMVLEALQALQERQKTAGLTQQRAAIATNRAALLQDANSFVAGNPKGDVTVVQFFDYRCPYCRQSMAVVRDLLKADPNIRLVYKEFPILGPQSLAASRIAVAARKDPRYERLHDALMLAPSPLGEDQALDIAAGIGLDRKALAEAAKSQEIDTILKANHTLAVTLGISGTPAFIVGDALVPGYISLGDLQKLVASARSRGGDRLIQSGG